MRYLIIMMIFTSIAYAKYDHCGNDYNCYYGEREREEQQEKMQEKKELQEYRAKQLHFQEQQVQEIQNQNSLLKDMNMNQKKTKK